MTQGVLAESGVQFDCSRDRGEPIEFEVGVGMVVRGWDEGLMQMSKGQRAELLVPPSKGYGKEGAGDIIPPDATLKFDVELVDITSAPLNNIKLPPHQRQQAMNQMRQQQEEELKGNLDKFSKEDGEDSKK